MSLVAATQPTDLPGVYNLHTYTMDNLFCHCKLTCVRIISLVVTEFLSDTLSFYTFLYTVVHTYPLQSVLGPHIFFPALCGL